MAPVPGWRFPRTNAPTGGHPHWGKESWALKAMVPVLCGLAARGYVRVPAEQLPELRRCPGPVAPDSLPASFLKHADEQTVAGMSAVLHAIRDGQLTGTDFRSWGV